MCDVLEPSAAGEVFFNHVHPQSSSRGTIFWQNMLSGTVQAGPSEGAVVTLEEMDKLKMSKNERPQNKFGKLVADQY
jgi:hypothetical protein